MVILICNGNQVVYYRFVSINVKTRSRWSLLAMKLQLSLTSIKRVHLIPKFGTFAPSDEDYMTYWIRMNLLKRPKMREFRINDGQEQTVTSFGRLISWENEEAKAKHYELIRLYWEAKRKRAAAAVKAVEGAN